MGKKGIVIFFYDVLNLIKQLIKSNAIELKLFPVNMIQLLLPI